MASRPLGKGIGVLGGVEAAQVGGSRLDLLSVDSCSPERNSGTSAVIAFTLEGVPREGSGAREEKAAFVKGAAFCPALIFQFLWTCP